MKEKMQQYFNTKYDSALFMNQNYIGEEKAIIPIYLHSKEEIYSNFDHNHFLLDDNLIHYIQNIAYYIPYDYSIVLKFEGVVFTKEEKEQLVKTINDQFGLIVHDMSIELKYNTWKAIKLFVVGSILLMISFFVRDIDHTFYISEILSIAGTFSIWEFVDTIWFDRKRKRIDKMNAGQLYQCTVVFEEENEM